MTTSMTRRYANLLIAILTIAFNALAVSLPLNGQDTGAISDRFDILFVPAAYVFSIWSLIYVGWIAFAIYQLLPAQRDNARLDRIGWLFVASGIFNMLWLVCWHYNLFPLSVVVMLLLLSTLIAIYLRLGIGRTAVSTLERWCVDIPFSVYLGWITVATIANVTQTLFYLGWNGSPLSPVLWTLILLAVAVLIGGTLSFTRGDIAYNLVLVWAIAGIAIKQADVGAVATGAWVAVALIALLIIVGSRQRMRATPTAHSYGA